MVSFIEDMLSPFRYFNFEAFYNQYYTVIDGIVFFGIFLALSKFVFNKYYKGIVKALSVMFALLLTIALLSVENKVGFNIKSFSWVSIGVILFIVFRFLKDLLQHGGMKFRTAFSVAYCTIYMSLAVWHPNVFDFVASKAPFLNGIAGLFCLLSLGMMVGAAWSAMTKGRDKIKVDDLQPAAPDHTNQEIKIENDELRNIKEVRGRLKTVDDIIDQLDQIEKIVKANPSLNQSQINSIRIYLSEISKKENLFRKSYNDVTYRFAQLGWIDSERMHRIEDDVKTASETQKRFIEAELNIERKKIEHDRVIIDFKRKLDLLITNFNNLINASIGQLNNHPESTLPGIAQAKDALKQMNAVIADIKQLERELISLHKTQRELFRGQKKK